MTMLVPNFAEALIVRESEAETFGFAQLMTRLLADGSDTGGALSAMRTTMGAGVEGAKPHTHNQSAELFYVIDGELQMLAGEKVITARKGDMVVVPPNMAHAFATTPTHTADFLIVQAPGLDRFGYFRLAERVMKGEATQADLIASQELYDNHFVDSPAWRAARDNANSPKIVAEGEI
ncbi:cupin [Ktedonobacter sp. SOSP1-85]|uniref:cupin domain-containing protein n=1 Tax=Ktedonobacter sp. SOSP1-85 TaxID=2778367 RepID=UPI0019169282|nr:cupin domain-containing protein [Ktedonobacter sp. SOSP1-85]GHO78006.1 cupin [Ktedonobacter sp. SOSP1-85]